jgi:hypothetical protein
MQRFHPAHDDMQGLLATALTGVTQYTFRQLRNTGMVFPHVASGDIFSITYQFSHQKQLQTLIDSTHIHYIPVASKNGNIAFSYKYGYFNHEEVIPDVLPNSGTTADIALLTTDQYKLKRSSLILNIAPPANEGYSSILMVHFTAIAPAAGNNWWTTGNEIAIIYKDAHYIKNRWGSVNEATD